MSLCWLSQRLMRCYLHVIVLVKSEADEMMKSTCHLVKSEADEMLKSICHCVG